MIGRVEGVPLSGPSVYIHVNSETRVTDFFPKTVLLGQRAFVRLTGTFQYVTYVTMSGVCVKTYLKGSTWSFDFLPDFLGNIPFHIGINCNDRSLFSSVHLW